MEVVSDWRFFSKLMAQGNGVFGKAFIIYLLPGASAMLLRSISEKCGPPRRLVFAPLNTSEQHGLRRLLSIPFVPLTIVLLIGTIFLPAQPWRHLTATLVYDVISAISIVIIAQPFIDTTKNCPTAILESNPISNLNYNPAEDPYYISNLNQHINPFIASALEGTEFTNIFHIVLESMREDSFPYDERGLLHQHIQKNMEPAENGVPITTENITPFISSLAENTLSWHTMWATVPYTHKAMLGRKLLLFSIANF
jgi:hypothetical protein